MSTKKQRIELIRDASARGWHTNPLGRRILEEISEPQISPVATWSIAVLSALLLVSAVLYYGASSESKAQQEKIHSQEVSLKEAKDALAAQAAADQKLFEKGGSVEESLHESVRQLTEENKSLRAQVQSLTSERDRIEAKLDALQATIPAK